MSCRRSPMIWFILLLLTVQCQSADHLLLSLDHMSRQQQSTARVTSIPEKLPTDIQLLDLAGNSLDVIQGRAFADRGLNNLQRIYLSRCNLREINVNAFNSLTNLIELDLSHNSLHLIHAGALSHCPLMRRLALNNNPIKRLKNGTFAALGSLHALDLSNCEIELIETKAFAGLFSLKQLHLNGNKLRTFSAVAVEPLSSMLELNLQGNRWNCDCRLHRLREWMIEKNIPLSFPPTCAEPVRLQERSWAELDLDEYACAPQLIVAQPEIHFGEGEDAHLECTASSLPYAQIEWSFKGRTISNVSLMSFGRQMYLIKESLAVDVLDDGTISSRRRYMQRFDSRGELIPPEKISVLTIMNAMPKDSGGYTCKATNKAGHDSGTVLLSVSGPRRNSQDVVVSYTDERAIGAILAAICIIVLLVIAAFCWLGVRHKETLLRMTFQRNQAVPTEPDANHAGTNGTGPRGKQIIVNHHYLHHGQSPQVETVVSNSSNSNVPNSSPSPRVNSPRLSAGTNSPNPNGSAINSDSLERSRLIISNRSAVEEIPISNLDNRGTNFGYANDYNQHNQSVQFRKTNYESIYLV